MMGADWVPGEGPAPARVMIIGSHPGPDALRQGRPFAGIVGRELDRFLDLAGLHREDVYLTLLVKSALPRKDEFPPELIDRWAPRLLEEVQRVNPEIILACSSTVSEWIVGGTEWEGLGLEAVHGLSLPHEGLGCMVIPAYHPAAGLHDGNSLLHVERDFEALKAAVRGEFRMPVDEYPIPDYRAVDDPDQLRGWLMEGFKSGLPLALDTEGMPESPWSVQLAWRPGEAVFVPCASDECMAVLEVYLPLFHLWIHNSLHDLAVLRALRIPVGAFTDTMVAAYHLCDEPQGLKPLAFRYAGMRMQDYEEVVRPAQDRLSWEYLQMVAEADWPRPKGDRRWTLNRYIAGYGKELRSGKFPDLKKRWEGIDEDIRGEAEEVLGPMPEAALADIPFDDALYYACRDADATVRVAPKLMERYREVFGV